MRKKNRKLMIAYNITQGHKDPSMKFWNKIGIGFINRDGSVNVKLDAFPINPRSGEFQLRPANKCFSNKNKDNRAVTNVPDPDPFNGEPFDPDDMPLV